MLVPPVTIPGGTFAWIAQCGNVAVDSRAGVDHGRRSGGADFPAEKLGVEGFGCGFVLAADFEVDYWLSHSNHYKARRRHRKRTHRENS